MQPWGVDFLELHLRIMTIKGPDALKHYADLKGLIVKRSAGTAFMPEANLPTLLKRAIPDDPPVPPLDR